MRITNDGIKVISINEVVKGKFDEALARATKSSLEYTSIEGFTFEIEICMDANEAMATIGMKAPEQVPEIY